MISERLKLQKLVTNSPFITYALFQGSNFASIEWYEKDSNAEEIKNSMQKSKKNLSLSSKNYI